MYLINLLAFAFLFAQIESSLVHPRYWFSTCSSTECTTALNFCLNCVGERMCKSCVTTHSPSCATCVDDIFNKDDLETVNGQQYLFCDISDPFQSKVCHFYCRGQLALSGQCTMLFNMPLCQCATQASSTTSTQ